MLHNQKYPKARARDFYKMIYQGVFGVGHIFSEKANEYLLEEVNRINVCDYADRALIEPVSPDGSMVRVYLRPFLRKGLDLDKLVKVMRKSAEIIGSEKVFLERWRVLIELVDSGEIELDETELDEVQNQINSEGLSPMHHTKPYRKAYYPAYRVVWKPFLHDVFGDL